MVKIGQGSNYWKVADLDGKTGIFVSELAEEKDNEGNSKLQIQVNVDGEVKIWGMGWGAAKLLGQMINEDGDTWKDAKVKFGYRQVNTARGKMPAMCAIPISFQKPILQDKGDERQETANPKPKFAQGSDFTDVTETGHDKQLLCPYCEAPVGTTKQEVAEHIDTVCTEI